MIPPPPPETGRNWRKIGGSGVMTPCKNPADPHRTSGVGVFLGKRSVLNQRTPHQTNQSLYVAPPASRQTGLGRKCHGRGGVTRRPHQQTTWRISAASHRHRTIFVALGAARCRSSRIARGVAPGRDGWSCPQHRSPARNVWRTRHWKPTVGPMLPIGEGGQSSRYRLRMAMSGMGGCVNPVVRRSGRLTK